MQPKHGFSLVILAAGQPRQQVKDVEATLVHHFNTSMSTNPMGVTNQEFINRAALNQPGPGDHDPRNDVLTGAKRAEEAKHLKYDASCAATGPTKTVTERERESLIERSLIESESSSWKRKKVRDHHAGTRDHAGTVSQCRPRPAPPR